MNDFSDYVVASIVFGAVLLFGCNYTVDTTLSTAIREKHKTIAMGIVSVGLMLVCSLILLAFSTSLNAALTHKPPPPANLLFWGLDKAAECDYDKVNEFIKVTNSRVVLFGEAKTKELRPPVDNIVGEVPDLIPNLEAMRTWYKFNSDLDWNAIVVFGINWRASTNVGIYGVFDVYTEHRAKKYITDGDYLSWETELKGEVCSFKTKNSSVTGRRPLKKPLSEYQGL